MENIQTLEQLLAEQLRLLKEFLTTTHAQTTLIQNEDTDGLEKNLEQRDNLIIQIDALKPKMNPLLAEQASRPGAANSAIGDLQEEISRILREITEINHKNQLAVRERMDFFQAEIRRANDTRKGVGAYIKGAEVFAAEFVDERQ